VLAGSSGSQDLTLGCTIWNTYGKEMMTAWWVCLWVIWIEGGFTLYFFQGYDGEVKYYWKKCSSNFRIWNKLVIVFPCGLQVDTFWKNVQF